MKIRTLCVFTALLAPAPLIAQKPEPLGSRVKLSRIWQHLLKLHDKDGDGKISSEEYGRGEVRFKNYDRDGNGVLNAADFPEGAYWNGFGPSFARSADRDRDNRVTRAEWTALIGRIDPDKDGVITMQELSRIAPPRFTARPALVRLSFDQDLDGVLEVQDLESLFRDLDHDGDGTLQGKELERRKRTSPRGKRRAPEVGESAPDFELPIAKDPGRRSRLSEFFGQAPVALIFGSYT
ncbi:MAG: EF-hand domain-containing protein [Planctomycetota bacterium]